MNLIFFLFAAPEDEHFEVKMRHFSQNASRCGAEEIRMCLIMTTLKVITLQWNTRICMINILAKRQRKLKQSRQSANTFVFTSVFFDIAFYQMQRRDHCEIYFPLIFPHIKWKFEPSLCNFPGELHQHSFLRLFFCAQPRGLTDCHSVMELEWGPPVRGA